VTLALLVLLSLVAQRALGAPGLPPALALVVVPAVWVVWPTMTRHSGLGFWPALALGLAWDLLMGPVIGPGAVAWSAAAMIVAAAATLVADRSPAAWALFGALTAILVILGRHLMLLPLGLAGDLSLIALAIAAALTGAWCGLVGWVRALELGTRLRDYRRRRLH